MMRSSRVAVRSRDATEGGATTLVTTPLPKYSTHHGLFPIAIKVSKPIPIAIKIIGAQVHKSPMM